MNSSVFRFLDLPPEIREKILIYFAVSPEPYIPFTPREIDPFEPSRPSAKVCLAELLGNEACEEDEDSPLLHPCFPYDLLLVNHQLYDEVRPLYWAHNKFCLLLGRMRKSHQYNYFLEEGFRDNRRLIRSLRLSISRWGAKNFFTETLIPLLEDMILNGALRELDVRVRYSAMWLWRGAYGKRTVGKELKGDHLHEWGSWAMEDVIEGSAPKALLRLCMDPYLEKVTISALFDMESRTDGQQLSFVDITGCLGRGMNF